MIESFGRPEIETWMPLGVETGSAPQARFLERSERPVPPGTDVGDLVRSEAERSRVLAAAPDVLATVSGLDPKAWRVARFTLRADRPEDGAGRTILHLARPGLPPAAPTIPA